MKITNQYKTFQELEFFQTNFTINLSPSYIKTLNMQNNKSITSNFNILTNIFQNSLSLIPYCFLNFNSFLVIF